LAPTLFVLGSVYVIGPLLPLRRRWIRAGVIALIALVVARYVHWRLFDTVLPAQGAWYEVSWIRFCFVVEMIGYFDLAILYLTFSRRSNRRAEANRHEARLRALPPDQLPSVDVLIPTYNEPLEVLEKTITGAMCLDYPNFRLWILDDGRRAWLKEFCERKGVGYLTRPDSAHAKAGNINHALSKTSSEFVAIFDADFIPHRNFLMRTVGFFADSKIGIVQLPHAFYNNDPMQTNLALRKALPHDQSFFFDAIMPSRDAWDMAFCCGSNSVIRRAALDAIGGGFPTESITEDMLLTLTLLRHGYITRYLSERLAFGLAPESMEAFFIQRQRWARGGIQIMYLASGPFGRGLTLLQRLMFLPTHWLTQSPVLILSLVVPPVFLWTGVLPFVNVTSESVVYYFMPTILAMVGGIWLFAPAQFFPLAAYVLNTFQSIRLLPHVLQTLVRPFGYLFKVTPKGRDAGGPSLDTTIFWFSAFLMALTFFGLVINTMPEYQIVAQTSFIPTAAIMASINILILFLVCMLALQAPVRRAEERFLLDEPVLIVSGTGTPVTGRINDLSLTGAGIRIAAARVMPAPGEAVTLRLSEVGSLAGTVVRRDGGFFGVRFNLPASLERDLLIRKLFTGGLDAEAEPATAWSATTAMLKVIWSHRATMHKAGLGEQPAIGSKASDKLPAVSLVIAPKKGQVRLGDLGAQRRGLAA
jgi:cellulose synthase (UDP-forming)